MDDYIDDLDDYIDESMPMSEVFREMEYVLTDNHDWSEETITDYFLSLLSKNNFRIKYKKFNRHEESKNGADWEWWLLTNEALLRFYVQAKKVDEEIEKRAIMYKTRGSDKLQIEKLIENSNNDNALPMYAFYSENILPTICPLSQNEECYKAIYLASAHELKNKVNNLKNSKLLHPMSCFFKLSRCSLSTDIFCTCCSDCKKYHLCEISDNEEDVCTYKMISLLQKLKFENLNEKGTGFYEILPEHIVIFQYANSVLEDNYFRKKFFQEYSYAIKVKNIIITDYLHRHSIDYNAAIVGINNININYKVILEKKFIISELEKILKEYPVILAIGLFGSYAKDCANVNSDVDLMLVYNLKVLVNTGFRPILDFLKKIIITLMKPIDFVDFAACDERFKEEVEEDIIWIV